MGFDTIEINKVYIENGHIKYLYFYFLGGDLRVIYNSDILKNRDPPLGLKSSQIEIRNFLGFFRQPPPPLPIGEFSPNLVI